MVFFALLLTAQTSFDLNALRISPHGDSFVTVESGAIVPSLEVRAQLYLNYQFRPLQLVSANGSRVGGLIDHRLDMAVLASVSLFDRLSIGLSIPATLYQLGRLTDVAVPSVAFGDLRLEPKVGLLDQKRHYINMAFTGVLTIPTASHGGFAGDRNVTAGGELDFSRAQLGPVRLGLNLGFLWRLKTQIYDLVVGPELYYRLGGGLDIAYFVPKAPVEVILELFGKTAAEQPFKQAAQSPLEWLASARYSPLCWFQLTAGGGRGLVAGYGAPAARAFLGATFTPLSKCGAPEPASAPVIIIDMDGDGILDVDDKCPSVPEDKDGFQDEDGCPDPDNDQDGVMDHADKCPTEAGPPNNDGCPVPDKDGDGVLDNVDKCPTEPEDKDGFQDEDGCPDTDNDGDGIWDAQDKCPDQPETINGVDDFDGCPDTGKSLVVVKSDSIQILEKVQFKTGSDKILPASFGLLDQVANVMRNHTELGRMRVEGHTDSDGPDDANMKLSQRRANSVRAYLVDHGVVAERLDAVGYGETKPLAPNSSKRGKEMNRRVAFTVIDGPATRPIEAAAGLSVQAASAPVGAAQAASAPVSNAQTAGAPVAAQPASGPVVSPPSSAPVKSQPASVPDLVAPPRAANVPDLVAPPPSAPALEPIRK